jgi:hypothetical protein
LQHELEHKFDFRAETWYHELGAVANGINRTVLHCDALVGNEQALEGHDAAAEVGLVLEVIEAVPARAASNF